MKIKLVSAFLFFTNLIWSNTNVAAPVNDNFADATPISCGQNYTGSTLEATLDEDDAPDASNVDLDAPNIWYSYTGSGVAEVVTLDLCASGYDTSYLVYTGTSGNLTLVAANDDNEAACGAGFRSNGTFESDGTTTYYITVTGYNATDVGAVDLTVSCIPDGSILIPDANFEQALIDLGIDSGVINGYIAPVGLDQVIDLDVSNKNISDLTGIEAFTALSTLNCSNNNLSELAITNSTALTAIILNDNTITNLDVTNNIALEAINLNDNLLTSLDVSQNLVLETLEARTNNLSGNLDVSQNLALETLLVSDNNQLLTIDLPVNGLLKYLIISNTQITNIDLTQTPALDNLYAFNCGLTSLDLSGNPALETFVIGQNPLTSLDLSANPALAIFSCRNMNSLVQLNLQSGNNTGVLDFNAELNPSLTCIQVDDVGYSVNAWTNIDAGTNFSTDCGYLTNDECVDAVTIPISDDSCNATVVGTLLGATDSNSLQCSGNLPNFSDIWFSFVATKTAHDIKILNTTGPSNTISHAVINAQTYNCGNITEAIYCADALQSEATGLTIGDTYYIQLYTYEASINSTFDICVSIGTSLKTYVPDDNFEQALIDLGYDDLLNHYVLTENIDTVESLNVFNKSIADLTGIEGFTALTSLEVSLNNLTSLDLSQNIALTYLDSEFNPLTAIDISQNVLLDYLRLNRTSFTTLNVTNNTALETLILTENELTNLDISQNLILEELSVHNSHQLATIQFPVGGVLHRLNMSYTQQLTNLDFSQIPTLRSLYADASGLTSIDLSANPALIVLFVSENLLTSIDVSENSALLSFYAKDMSSLVELNLQNGNNTNFTIFDITGNVNLACVQVDDVAYSTTNWTNVDASVNFSTDCDNPIQVAAKVYLQGAMLQHTDGFMRTDLKDNNLVPSINSPYADGIGVSEQVFIATGQDRIVDWVWVELRDATDPTIIIDGKSALLQRDGDVVDASASDTATPVYFYQAPGDYYVVIKHRNHLGIMSNNALSLSDVVTTVDFTDGNNQITYGANAQTTFGMPANTLGMWCGNVNSDMVVQYAGTTPDTPTILSTILNDVGNFLNFPTYILNGYNANDINMDGTTQYTGTTPDTPFILQNTLAHPGNFLNFSTYQIIEQLPENE